MNIYKFLLNNKRLISFGFILAFYSSFGQTFLISLYVPDISRDLQLSSFAFGLIYGLATILSALFLIYLGKLIDSVSLINYTLFVVVGLIISCILLGLSLNIYILFVAIFGLRLFGQGLLSHISNTATAKYFLERRGTAISFTSLGFSAGEAVFPLLIGTLLLYFSWQNANIVLGVFIAITLLPFVLLVLHKQQEKLHNFEKLNASDIILSRLQLIKERRFQLIIINAMILPAIVTGMFFYQLLLAEDKNWSKQWIALSFFCFAMGRILFSLIGGKLVDKFTSVKIFPYYLIPFMLGLILIAFFSHRYIALIYYTLTGFSLGLAGVIGTAILAEIYGTKNLGKIRSLLSAISVFSTSLSPAVFGFILDNNFGFAVICLLSALVILFNIVINFRLQKQLNSENKQMLN